MAEADYRGLFDLRAIEAVLDAGRGRRGIAALRELLAERDDPALTRSYLEDRLLQLCREASLPPPAVNVRVASFEVDFAWSEQRLIVETDGRAAHTTASAFERDRLRDQRLAVGGWRVVRFTYRQLARDPAAVGATLRGLLGS